MKILRCRAIGGFLGGLGILPVASHAGPPVIWPADGERNHRQFHMTRE